MSIKLKRPEVPVPEFMKLLPLTERGYHKPWFVKADDFRIVDGHKAGLAVTKQKCWICGNPFKPNEYALIGDDVAAMVRACKEPACHVECATYALQVCPFLLYPTAKRREAGLDEEQKLAHSNESREVKIDPENPGKFFLTIVKDFTYEHADQLMFYNESDVIERQYWIAGKKQKCVPNPIIPLDNLSVELQKITTRQIIKPV